MAGGQQAKRLADRQSLGLAQAQRKIAAGYGFATWADLMHRVDSARGGETAVPLSPLAAAAHAGDLPAVQRLLREGHAIEGARGDGNTPLWLACASAAPAEVRIAIAEALRSPEVIAKMHGGGSRVTYLNPTDFRTRIIAETQMFGDIIRKGNIKLT